MESISQVIKAKEGLWWRLCLAISLSSYAVFRVLSLVNLSLTNFHNRTIGIAVLQGVDASRRSFFYVVIILTFILVFSFGFLGFSYLEKIIQKNYGDQANRIEELLFFLSLTSLLLYLLLALNYTLTGARVYLHSIYLIYFLIGLTVLSSLLKRINPWKESGDFIELMMSFIFPLPIIFTFFVISKRAFVFNTLEVIFYLGLWAFFFIAYFLVVKRRIFGFKKWSSKEIESALFSALIPYSLIPMSIPLANELQFNLSRYFYVSPRLLSLLIIGLLFLVSVVIFSLRLVKGGREIDQTKVMTNFIFPLIIATFTLYQNHRQFIESQVFDLFHDGENLITVQQLFSFGKIPFIDLLPTHGLSESFSQIAYALVNGYRPIEPWLWSWLTIIFSSLLLYFLLKKITTPVLAFLFVLFLPLSLLGLRGGYHVIVFLPALLISRLLSPAQENRKGIFFGLILIFIFLWRLDFGLAVLLSFLTIILLLWLRRVGEGKRQTGISFFRLMRSFFLTLFIFSLIFLAITLMKGQSVAGLFTQIWQFLQYQAPIQSYANLYREYSPLIVLQYVIVPLISIFYLLFFAYKVVIEKEEFDAKKMMLIFVATFSLIMSLRSTQRHSLVSSFRPYLDIFLLILLPFAISKKSIYEKSIYLALLMVVISLLWPFPQSDALLANQEPFQLQFWHDHESRLQVDNRQYRELVRFMDQNLDVNQTFFDFSNATFLYIVSDREFIPYVIPNLYHSSELIQTKVLEAFKEQKDQGLAPYVIFKQGSPMDQVDEVPNEMRSYRVAEFIYQNYYPYRQVGKFEIWRSNELKKDQSEDKEFSSYAQTFDLRKLPYIWGSYDPLQAGEKTEIQQSLIDKPLIIEKGRSVKITFTGEVNKMTGNYLQLRIKASKEAEVKLSYDEGNEPSVISFTVLPADRFEDYLIRISTQWDWVSKKITSLRIEPETDIEIEELNIRKGD